MAASRNKEGFDVPTYWTTTLENNNNGLKSTMKIKVLSTDGHMHIIPHHHRFKAYHLYWG
jgi:hypothetical protein